MNSQKKVMVTCYDATFSRLIADSECVDYLLVGDSLGMVIGGASNTLGVTLEHMLYHTLAVSRGLKNSRSTQKPLLIADLPVDTYRNPEEALVSSRRLIEAGASMVKLEGPMIQEMEALRSHQVKVCGHIGLTPQSIQDYRLQGKTAEDQERLRKEALAIQNAGAEMIVFEMMPSELAQSLTKELSIPTIGIGAGVHCDGQVLVLYDLLGLQPHFNPKFLKKYREGGQDVQSALKKFSEEVRMGIFPDSAHTFFNHANL